MFSVYLCDGTHIGDSDDRQDIEEMIHSTHEEYPEWDCYIRQGNRIISVARLRDGEVVVSAGAVVPDLQSIIKTEEKTDDQDA